MGFWSNAGNLNVVRNNHTATLLPDGRVMITGGAGASAGNEYLNSVEFYEDGHWTMPPDGMANPHWRHTATLLRDGMVLIIGCVEGFGERPQPAELYDPFLGVWGLSSNDPDKRTRPTATLLNDGRVLVVGGRNADSGRLLGAVIYDPGTGGWEDRPMIHPRLGHTATLMADGSVLCAGGVGNVVEAELFRPKDETWVPFGQLTEAHSLHTATLLQDGSVLITGGYEVRNQPTNTVELLMPNGTWKRMTSMNVSRRGHTATLLNDGTVLVTGGSNLSGMAELYDSRTNIWKHAASLAQNRSEHTATLMRNGTVLVVGGSGEHVYAQMSELYTPEDLETVLAPGVGWSTLK